MGDSSVVPQHERRAPEARSRRDSLLAALLAWVIPGAGHLFLRRRGRAAIFFLLVITSVAVGWSLDGNLYRAVAGQPLTLLGMLASMGTGLPYFLLRFVAGYHGLVDSPTYEYGTAFLLTGGLMNLLLVLDAWDIALGRKS